MEEQHVVYAGFSSTALRAVSSHGGEHQIPQVQCNWNTHVNVSLLALSRYMRFGSLYVLTRLASAARPATLQCQI